MIKLSTCAILLRIDRYEKNKSPFHFICLHSTYLFIKKKEPNLIPMLKITSLMIHSIRRYMCGNLCIVKTVMRFWLNFQHLFTLWLVSGMLFRFPIFCDLQKNNYLSHIYVLTRSRNCRHNSFLVICKSKKIILLQYKAWFIFTDSTCI